MSATLKCQLYPTVDGFIGKLEIPDVLEPSVSNHQHQPTSSGSVETVVILDRSGSMGQNVERVVEQYLPNMFLKLGYAPTDVITLITFDSETSCYTPKVSELESLRLRARGSTHMAPAVLKLGEILASKKPERIRILTLSDGDLHDQDSTVKVASDLVQGIRGSLVNSKAVRLFTSTCGQPDTRGLASVLQLSTVDAGQESSLVDIDAHLDPSTIVDSFVSLFQGDGLDNALRLRAEGALLLANPWNEMEAVETMHLLKGSNTFWLRDMPGSLSIDGVDHVHIDLELCDRLSLSNLQSLLQTKLDFFATRLKLLKIVNTPVAQAEVKLMIDYFEKLQRFVEAGEVQILGLEPSKTLRGRISYLKTVVQRRFAGVFNEFAQIANDNRVAEMNSAQQADYLREMDRSRNARALARRTLNQGVDFSETLRREVKAMREHLSELADLDDSEHITSFCCLETTLGGIRATCALLDQDDLLEALEATDILQMINIVGIPCHGPIGDYPDPMTWRVDRIFCGCFVSLSDVLMHKLQVIDGPALKVPGATNSDPEISNVIPLFDDARVQRFMRKYAPSLLEYTCSVGMRRVISGVPLTYTYTVCAGLWKMVEVLNTDKSERNLKAFVNLTHTYDVAIGRYFQYVIDILIDQSEPTFDELGQRLSCYIANNGLTNMIAPIATIVKTKNTRLLSRMPEILRAIYAFEVYQAMKRVFRGVEQADVAATNKLNQLLGIDLEKYSTTVGPLFENPPELEKQVFYDQYHVDETLLEELCRCFWYVDYVNLLPAFFKAVHSGNPEAALRGVEAMNERSVTASFGIDCTLKQFKLHNIVQSILYNSKALRVDDEAKRMKIIDLGMAENAERLLRSYVRKQYAEKYRQDLATKDAQEKAELLKLYVEQLTTATSVDQFSKLISEGFRHKNRLFQVPNAQSYGFTELNESLMNLTNQNVPFRLEKLKLLILGCDDQGSVVWNNGSVLRMKLGHLKDLFLKLDAVEMWEHIMDAYRANNIHTYRGGEEKKNRHGHSNDKMSYWAMGFQTLDEFRAAVTVEEWKAYEELHFNCCGVDKLLISE